MFLYPNPLLMIFTSVSLPSTMIGFKIAPLPSPSISIIGGELYPEPWLLIIMSIILPSDDTSGLTCAFSPFIRVITGCLL